MERDSDADPGVTEVDRQVREELSGYIGSASFPAERTNLVETAQENGAPDHWLTVLRHLPPDYLFDDVEEVSAALGYGYRARPF